MARPKSLTTINQHAQVTGGLAGASARGEAGRVQWVKAGLVVPGERLAQAWGLTRQVLAAATDRGEVFAVKVGNRLYYPQAFLGSNLVASSSLVSKEYWSIGMSLNASSTCPMPGMAEARPQRGLGLVLALMTVNTTCARPQGPGAAPGDRRRCA